MKPFRHFLLTVTLLAGLSLPAAAQLIPSIDNPARNWAQGISCGRDTDVDDFLQYFPLAANVGLGFLVPAKHELKERVVLSLTATATMEALVYSTKHIVRIPRPDSGRRNSFPSGHTGMAFVGAELVRAEYGWGYGAAAYAVAATTGFLRMYNDRHWLSDVVVGAAAGVLYVFGPNWIPPEWQYYAIVGLIAGIIAAWIFDQTVIDAIATCTWQDKTRKAFQLTAAAVTEAVETTKFDELVQTYIAGGLPAKDAKEMAKEYILNHPEILKADD